jgi:hypothetical protein
MTLSTFDARRAFSVAVIALLGACGGGSSPGGGAGATGTDAGSGGAAGTGGASPGVGGGATGATGDAGTSGAGGSTSGAAGVTASGGTGGVTSTGGAGAGGGVAGNGGAAGGAAGTSDGGAAGSSSDGGARPDGGGSSKILIYGVTTGFRHGSITAAANAITAAAATHGLTTELVGCTNATNTPAPTKLTAQAFAGYGAVILLANSGEPFGYPATTEIQNLVDYVKNGGALVAIEDADHCYDGQFNGHPASQPYVNLIGNDFVGHPGGVAPARCTKVGTHPSVMQLPATFGTTDEIYQTTFRMDNQVVVTCVSSGTTVPTMRPISYVREEGAGRMFYTALGHNDAVWTAPMDAAAANTRLVEDHVIPALLWAMHR